MERPRHGQDSQSLLVRRVLCSMAFSNAPYENRDPWVVVCGKVSTGIHKVSLSRLTRETSVKPRLCETAVVYLTYSETLSRHTLCIVFEFSETARRLACLAD
jgi:hypothetical protein